MTETPPYDDALAAFRRFMAGHGFATDLAWVFREDVTNCRRQYWVHVPLPEANADLARRYFEMGRRNGLGVTLSVLCRLGARSACFVWWPEDEEAASYAMQGWLKLQVPDAPADAVAVRGRWLWGARRWINRRRRCVTFADSLPSRDDVAEPL